MNKYYTVMRASLKTNKVVSNKQVGFQTVLNHVKANTEKTS